MQKLKRVRHREHPVHKYGRHQTESNYVPSEDNEPQRLLTIPAQPDREQKGSGPCEDIEVPPVERHLNGEQLPVRQFCKQELDRNSETLKADQRGLRNLCQIAAP